jgi:hypothetical protein
MTTANIDGIVALSNAVAATFTANTYEIAGVPVQVGIGLKARSLWSVPRVVFIPGEFDGTLPPKPLKEGTLKSPEQSKSFNPRELVSWERLVTLSVYAFDGSDPQNEALQIQAVTNLLEVTLQAIKGAFTPNLSPTDPITKELGYTGQQGAMFDGAPVTRVYPGVEFTLGCEMLVTFTQLGPLFDAPIPTVVPTEFVLSSEFTSPAPPS